MSAMPARAPAALICLASSVEFSVASAWNVTEKTPNFAYSTAQRSTSSIIRCTSSGLGLSCCNRATVAKPKVRFGTKWLSMMSTWIRSLSEIVASSDSKLAKSADRIEGQMRTLMQLAYRFRNKSDKHGVGAVDMRPELNRLSVWIQLKVWIQLS